MPFAVSPASRFRFIAKIAMRVRLSSLNFTVEVRGNGPPFNVTDSRAIARVEVESLIKTGALGFAALVMPAAPQRPVKRVMLSSLRKALEQRERLIVIGSTLHYGICKKLMPKAANCEDDTLLDWWRGHPANNPG